MASAAPTAADKTKRKPRRWRWLLLLLIPVAGGVFWLSQLLQPEKLGQIVLDKASEATGLTIETSTPAQVSWYPDLHVELGGLSARLPGQTDAIISADSVDLVLPLSALTDPLLGRDSGELRISSLRLRSPTLDLDRLNDWQAQITPEIDGPPTPYVLPRIDSPLRIENGAVRQAQGWQISALNLRTSALHEGEAFQLKADMQLTRIDADPILPAAADTAEAAAAPIAPALPVELSLQVTPSVDGGALRLSDISLSVTSPPDAVIVHGDMRLIPGGGLRFAIDSRIEQWPQRLPELPLPPDNAPLDLHLAFDGDSTARGALSLRLKGAVDEISGEMRLGNLLEWIRPPADAVAHVLPPISGTLHATRLVQSGALLNDVDIRFVDEPDQHKADDANNAGDAPENGQ